MAKVGIPTKGHSMTDPQIFDYLVLKTVLDNGQEVLVQIFMNGGSEAQYLAGRMSFRTATGDSWSPPYELEKQ